MATTDQRSAARLAALRQDPDVVVRERTSTEPLVPAFEVDTPVDVLDLMDRGHDADALESPVE